MVDFDVFYNGDLFIGLVFDHSLKGASLWDLLVSKVLQKFVLHVDDELHFLDLSVHKFEGVNHSLILLVVQFVGLEGLVESFSKLIE